MGSSTTNEQLLASMNLMIQQNITLTQQLAQNQATQRDFHIIPDFSKTIENFDKGKGPHEVKLWLEQVEAAALVIMGQTPS